MGYDAVDREVAAERGVVVTRAPGVLAQTTADLTFALILMARRRLGAAHDSPAAGQWGLFRADDYLGLDVHGATLGLIGYRQSDEPWLAPRAAASWTRTPCCGP